MKLPKLPNNFAINICTGGMRLYGFWEPDFSEAPIWSKILYVIRGVIAFMIILGFYLIIQTIDLWIIFGDVNLMIGIGFLLMTNFANAFKIFNLIYRKKEFTQIIKLSLKKKIEATHPEQLKIIQRYEWVNLRDLLIFFFLATFSVIGWAAGPVLEGNYIGDKRKLPMEAWYPYNKYKTPAYEINYTHQMIGILAAAYTNLMHDNLMAAIISLASVQIELLMFSLENICPVEDVEDTNDETATEAKITFRARSEEDIYNELRKCIKYHQEIIEMTDVISLGVNPVAFAQLSASSIIICVTLYQLSVESSTSLTTTIGTLLYLGCMVWQVFLYCWHGNELMLNSTRLILSSYKSKWYNCSIRTQKMLVPLMARSLQPIQLTAGYIVELSIDTYMAILKSAYSFYTVISQAGP